MTTWLVSSDKLSLAQHSIGIQNTADWETASLLASLEGEEFVTDTNAGHSRERGENKARFKTDIDRKSVV